MLTVRAIPAQSIEFRGIIILMTRGTWILERTQYSWSLYCRLSIHEVLPIFSGKE